jgi:anti-anti-sigma factor
VIVLAVIPRGARNPTGKRLAVIYRWHTPTTRRWLKRARITELPHSDQSSQEPDQPFAVEARIIQGTAIVVLSGESDIVVAPVLAERLTQILASRPRQLIFDMARVTFIDCATARLITLAGQSPALGGRVLIRQPSAVVRRVLDVTRLVGWCDIEE